MKKHKMLIRIGSDEATIAMLERLASRIGLRTIGDLLTIGAAFIKGTFDNQYNSLAAEANAAKLRKMIDDLNSGKFSSSAPSASLCGKKT